MSADGADYGRTYLRTGDIRELRELSFTVGDKPSEWGTSPEAAPPVVR
ncbi:hypothetical protein [Streptomyces flavofungini]